MLRENISGNFGRVVCTKNFFLAKIIISAVQMAIVKGRMAGFAILRNQEVSWHDRPRFIVKFKSFLYVSAFVRMAKDPYRRYLWPGRQIAQYFHKCFANCFSLRLPLFQPGGHD